MKVIKMPILVHLVLVQLEQDQDKLLSLLGLLRWVLFYYFPLFWSSCSLNQFPVSTHNINQGIWGHSETRVLKWMIWNSLWVWLCSGLFALLCCLSMPCDPCHCASGSPSSIIMPTFPRVCLSPCDSCRLTHRQKSVTTTNNNQTTTETETETTATTFCSAYQYHRPLLLQKFHCREA